MDGYSPALKSESTHVLLDMTDLFWELLKACWGEPSIRPTIKEVGHVLQDLVSATLLGP